MNISAQPAIAAAVAPQNIKLNPSHIASTSPSAENQLSKAQLDNTPSAQEIKQIQSLKSRDREVRAHEAAHLAAAGHLAQGGATFSYQRGPDGVRYAVGGEVSIDTAAIQGDPIATLEKAQRIRAAALAPAQPSSQDLNVAAQAAQLAIQARAEINQQRVAPSDETTSDNKADSSTANNSNDSDRISTVQQTTNNPFTLEGAAENIINLVA